MSRYELYLFVHIVGAIVWLGAGVLFQVLAARADRTSDQAGLGRIADDSAALSTTLFIPASLTVLVMGLLMVFDGPWGFDSLWVSLGLAGYLATFLTGLLVMKPSSERIAALFARDGGMSAEATLEIRKLLAKGRVDTIVLYLVVAVMVLKPTADDVGILVAMAAVVVLGLAWTAQRLRALDASAGHGRMTAGAPAS